MIAIVVTLFGVVSCGKAGQSDDLGPIQKLADEACACKHVTCASAARSKWAELEKTRWSAAKLSASDAVAFKKHALRFATCVTDITNAASDSVSPPPATPTATP